MSKRNHFLLTAFALAILSPTLEAATRMIFPRVLFQKDRFIGIAIANPTDADADVVLRAWNRDGTAFSGTGATNPRTQKITKGSQYVKLATEIFFESGVPAAFDGAAPTRLWLEVTSSTDGLTGFYLEGDSALNFLDGSDLSGSGTDLILPILENSSGSSTEASIVNPDATAAANVGLTFYREDGTTAGTKSSTIPANGALQGPLSDLFPDIGYSQVHGVRIRSDRPVAAYGSIFGPGNSALTTIAAENVTLPSKTLYFPQLAEGTGWSTAVGVQNMTGSDILVTLTAYKEDGSLFTAPTVKQNPVTQSIKAWGVLHAKLSDQTIADWFGFSASGLQVGWIKVETGSPAIHGFVEYSAGSTRALVPAQLKSYSKAIFSYQVQAAGYFTGLAILNPGSVATNVEITSIRGNATTHGKTQMVLKPGQKVSKLLYELVSESANSGDGSVFIKSDSATIATQLFGTGTYSALANIAPQEVTTSFDPGQGFAKLTLSPLLSVVETGKKKQFTASGSVITPTWSPEDGDPAKVGTISATGEFTAPSNKPDRHNLTVLAKAGALTAGATIDVVQREQLTGGLTLLTAVAYLENLSRFFIAEQQVLSSSPSVQYAASSTNTKISRVDPGSSTPQLLKTVNGDTVMKMLPFVDGANSYLILAGYDTGSIYRLNVATGSVATILTGLNKPTSLAFDPVTGNLLVAELSQISVVQRSQLTAPAGPGSEFRAPTPYPRRLPVLNVASPQGIAVDNCSGAIYATLADGTLHEYKGINNRIVVRGLNKPKQIQVIYRDGLPCSEGMTLAVIETSQITLVYPASGRTEPLITGITGVQDITFFPSKNPYTPGGEASIGLAEGPPGTRASQISEVAVGGVYQAVPPSPVKTIDQTVGTAVVPYDDPAGDTFATSLTTGSGNQIPDILAVDYSRVGGFHAIALTFSFPVAPMGDPYAGNNAPNSIDGTLWLDTGTGGIALQEMGQYQPLAPTSDFLAQYSINLVTGLLTNTVTGGGYPYEGGEKVAVTYLGNTVSLLIPVTTITDPTRTRIVILIANRVENTDIAPNAGAIRLAVPKGAPGGPEY